MAEPSYQLLRQSALIDSGKLRPKPRAAQPLDSRIFYEQDWQRLAFSLQLSGRQLQIVRYIFDDLTEHAMSLNLGISENTVHTHIRRLHHKLQVGTRVKVVLRIMQESVKLSANGPS